ncbi:MAG TPA: metallophosphoesterase [Mycobacteriales bacterium]|nr:metallophosphoesterase [Mycobacteriales bacterium]
MRLPSRRSSLVTAEVVLVGVLGALLGLFVAGSVRIPVGPFDADLSLRPALTGSTTVDVPPLGQLHLDTHDGPVRLGVAVASLRADAARDIVADPASLADLGGDVQSDLRRGVVELVLRTLLVAVVGAAALGLLVFRQRWRRIAAATGAGLGMLLAAGAFAGLTYDDRALAQPRFSGLLASAPAAVGDVRDLLARFDVYQLQLGRLVANVSQLYAVTSSLPVFLPTDDTIRVLHVSDLHLNPTAFEVIGSTARQFSVDVIVDTGDINDWGSPPEGAYVNGIADLPAPYVYVRGNHDSGLTQLNVAAQPNAVVLDGPEIVEVGGVRFLGMGDPRFTPDKSTGDDDAPAERMLAVGRTLAREIRTAFEPPDIVAVHDPISARPLMGQTPLVLAGHRHQREDVREDDTLLMIQGSTGVAGLRALEGDRPTPITLTVLYLDPETRELQAYDDITLGGLGANDASIRRTVAGQVLAQSQEEDAEEGRDGEGADGEPGTPPTGGTATTTPTGPGDAPAEEPGDPPAPAATATTTTQPAAAPARRTRSRRG